MGDKRGQITIFIIIAIIIIAAVLVFFFWIKPTYITPYAGRIGLEKCMGDAVENSIANLGKQAGFQNPELFYKYKDEKIGYLCYTNLYYKPCLMQKPFVKQHFESELTDSVKTKIYECYDNALEDLKKKGYEVTGDKKNLSISFEPNQIIIDLEAPVVLNKESSVKYTRFTTTLNSPLYDMLMVSTSILQYETKYGDSDINNLMFYYPDLIIDKLKQDDGTTIYIIEDSQTKTRFQFASRSYALPAGYGVTEGLVP